MFESSAFISSSAAPFSMNRICDPSGDHDGPNAEKSGDDVGVVIACAPVPFALTTQIAYGLGPTTNASLLESGDQAIAPPSLLGAATVPRLVSCVWPVPSGFIVQTSVDPAVVFRYAIFELSGAHCGSGNGSGDDTSVVARPDPTFTFTIAAGLG